MSKFGRKASGIALALVMLVSLLPAASATEANVIWVGGQCCSSSESGTGWTWDADNAVLSLNEFIYAGAGHVVGSTAAAIWYEGTKELTIKFSGKTVLTATATATDLENIYGIYSKSANVTIIEDADASAENDEEGSSTLYITSGTASKQSVGIKLSGEEYSLTIGGNASLIVSGGDVAGDVADDHYSVGISCKNISIIEGAKVAVWGGSEGVGHSIGIDCWDVYLNNSFVTSSALGIKGDGESIGVNCLNITGENQCCLISFGGDISGKGKSTGIVCCDISLNKGLLMVAGSDISGDGDSTGIDCYDISLTNSVLTVAGGDISGDSNSTGIDCDDISIEDAIVTVAGGDISGNGDSTGIDCDNLSIKLTEEPDSTDDTEYMVTASGGDVSGDGDSTGIDCYDITVKNATVKAVGGDISGSGDSTGIDALSLNTADWYSSVSAEGGAGRNSYGIYVADDVTIGLDSQVDARGGKATYESCGFKLDNTEYNIENVSEDSDEDENSIVRICNGGQLEAHGGEAGSVSRGVDIHKGRIVMENDDSEEPTAELKLKAYGGKAPRSIGIDIACSSADDDEETEPEPAILLCDDADLSAAGGETENESTGLYISGSIALRDSAYLNANAVMGALNSIGIRFDGSYDLTLTGSSKLLAMAYNSYGQSVAIDSYQGTISVAENCALETYASGDQSSAAIANLKKLIPGGTIGALADSKSGISYGILFSEADNSINIITGDLMATGQSAALCGVVNQEDEEQQLTEVTITAPHIVYSEEAEEGEMITVEPADSVSTLSAGQRHKLIIAAANGKIASAKLTDITETIAYGKEISFTAKANPNIFVKVEDEYWSCGDTVISRNAPAAPGAGIWRYTLVLVPAYEEFEFDDEVMVFYNDEYYEFIPKDGKLIITTLEDPDDPEDTEVFIPDVELRARHVPAQSRSDEEAANKPDREAEKRFDPVEPEKGGSMSNFKLSDTYTEGSYSDVDSGDWYTENIRAAVNYGLLPDNGGGDFGVGEELKLSEALEIAARLHNLYFGGSGKFEQDAGEGGYQVFSDYAERYGFFVDEEQNMTDTITRGQFAAMISAAMPDEALMAINDVSSIPDVSPDDPDYAAILRLYNAGILTGVDLHGSFAPDAPITREQMAAVVTRVVDPALRKQIAP